MAKPQKRTPPRPGADRRDALRQIIRLWWRRPSKLSTSSARIPDAKRRLVYLKLTNNEKITRKNCVLTYVEDGKTSTRELSTIYLNEKIVYDTIWLKSGTTAISAVLQDADGKELWKGSITIGKAKTERVIAKSTIYNNATLKPGTVRGVNYYPRHTPWSAWTSQSPSTWDSEFKEISSKLNVNAIRTFAECWETDQMLGGCAPLNIWRPSISCSPPRASTGYASCSACIPVRPLKT